jgi:hypothetical protein
MGRQVHFVDGADGGYARAAEALKEQIALAAPATGGRRAPAVGYQLADSGI